MRGLKRLFFGLWIAFLFGEAGFAQIVLTWQQVRDKFEAANSTLGAGRIGVEEFRAEEITAYLRPNPNAALLIDQLYPFYTDAFSGTKGTAANIGYRPFENSLVEGTLTYLHERQHKRELRLESAQGAASRDYSWYGCSDSWDFYIPGRWWRYRFRVPASPGRRSDLGARNARAQCGPDGERASRRQGASSAVLVPGSSSGSEPNRAPG